MSDLCLICPLPECDDKHAKCAVRIQVRNADYWQTWYPKNKEKRLQDQRDYRKRKKERLCGT